MVERYVGRAPVDGVVFDRQDVFDLVRYYLGQ